MQSYLIVGGTKEERFQKAQNVGGKVQSVDRIVLEAENSLGIDDIRSLQHQLSFKPYASSSKIAILPRAEKLTIPAQNAMLKLLEEPPKDTVIILSSPTTEALLPTIVSRCQIIRLISKPQIEINQLILNSQLLIINSILTSGVGERIKIAGEIAQNRGSAIEFCQAQLVIWRKEMLKAGSREQKAERAKTLREIQKTLKMLEANVNPKLCLETLLLQYPYTSEV